MKPSSSKTSSQKLLAFPLITGFLAGLAGVIYLFNIPADPKNSIVFGFSLFRLLEGTGLLAAALCCLVIFTVSRRNAGLPDKILFFLGWSSAYPWSVVVAWLGFLLSLLSRFFVATYFPQFAPVIQRLLPLFIWIIFFVLIFLISYACWVSWKVVRTTAVLLLKVSLIVSGLVILAGTILYPAKIGLMIRQGSLALLIILFINLVFVFQEKGILSSITSFMIVGLLFGGAIAGVWTSAISDLNIISGLLPFNDANGYFHGGRVVADGQLMFPFSAKRPLFPALMGVFLWLTRQNLKLTIGCLVMVGGLVTYFSSREIRKSAGTVAAAFFIIGLFVFARRFIGSTMSEVIGLPLGTIGFVLLWSSAVRQRLADAAVGMLLVSLGLLSRAGPFFLLPILVIWAGWGLRGEKKYNWKAFIVTVIAAGLGFAFNSLIYHFLAGSNSAPMANFSYTIYGLVVGGKGWKQYIVDHPDVLTLVDPYQSQAIYRYAWEAFLANPFATMQGAFRYWGDFLSFEWYGAFGYIEGASKLESLIGRGVMALLSVGGFVYIIKEFRKPVISMLLAGMIGIFLSVPFVPPLDAEIRTYAAAMPWFVSLGMLGLIGIAAIFKKSPILSFAETDNQHFSPGLWATALSLVFLMVFAPLIVHAVETPMEIPQQTNCPSGEDAVITTVHRGSYINIREDTSIKQTMVPDIRYSDFIRSMHDSPMYSLAVQLMPVTPGSSFLTGYNWAEGHFENVLAPTVLLDQNQGWVEMCGWRETQPDEYGFFHAESISLLQK